MAHSAIKAYDAAQSQSIDAEIETRFLGLPHHRARDVGSYDVEKLVDAHKDRLLRSVQEFLPSSTGFKRVLHWVSLLIELEENSFLQITAKTSTYNSNQGFEGIYTVVAHASKPEVASVILEKVMKTYSGPRANEGPAFHIVKGSRDTPTRVPLEEKVLMDDLTLDLHYGENFSRWAEGFARSISLPGLSILKGPPGTGKTSFLRHLMFKLQDSHRFFYVPIENADILEGTHLHNLWAMEERNYPAAKKVIVLEDAEKILSDRKSLGGSNVSGLLNLTDGFVSDLIQVHLICTINCEINFLDSALLRPGRQRAFREFENLDYDRALSVAKELGVTLDGKREYSLAEIYAAAQMNEESLLTPERRRIGF